MYAAFQAFLDEGHEVICFEPFFDQYAPNITMSGGRLVYCPIRPASSSSTADKSASDGGGTVTHASSRDWSVDMRELESLITKRTKMIVLNTPHNPVGKVFTRTELDQIAQVCILLNTLTKALM